MWANHKDIARRWAHEYPGQHDLPMHVKDKKKKHKKKSAGLADIVKQAKILFDAPDTPVPLPTHEQLGLEVGNKFKEHTPLAGGVAGGVGGALLGAGLGAGANWIYNKFRTKDKDEEEPGVGYGAMLGALAGGGLGAYGGHRLGQYAWDRVRPALPHLETYNEPDLPMSWNPTEATAALSQKARKANALLELGKLKYAPEQPAKEAKAKRPDRYNQFNEWMHKAYSNPKTVFGAIMTPVQDLRNSIKDDDDDDKHKMTKKQAMKAGFLLRCAEEGLTLEQIENRVDELLQKNAFWDTVGKGVGTALGVGTGLLTKALDLGAIGAVGAPVVVGGLGGYLAYKLRDKPSLQRNMQEDLQNEYLTLADEAKRKAKLRKLQAEEPGTIVKLQ